MWGMISHLQRFKQHLRITVASEVSMEALKASFQEDVLHSVESLLTKTQSDFYFDAHRSDILQQIDHHWKYSGTVLLYGDPGVGKTALIKQAQDSLPDDVISLYIDGKVLNSADDILNFVLDAFELSGGPIKTRREATEKLLQHAELEADLGRYLLIYIDHFDALSDSAQRFFWQLSQLQHSQMKMVLVTDSYYLECLDGFGVADSVPQLQLQALHPHKMIHHLNERLAPSGIEMHHLLSVRDLDQLVANAKGNILQLENALQHLISEHQRPKPKKNLLSSSAIAVVALSLILTAVIYVLLVGDQEAPEALAVPLERPTEYREESLSYNVKPLDDLETKDDELVLDEPLKEIESQGVQVSQVSDPILADAQDSPVNDTTEDKPILKAPFDKIDENVSNVPLKEESPAQESVDAIPPVTIQLMGVYDRSRLDGVLKKHPDHPLEIVQTERNGRAWFVLLYGAYPDKAAAKRQINRIPPELKAGDPWIRMREEIR